MILKNIRLKPLFILVAFSVSLNVLAQKNIANQGVYDPNWKEKEFESPKRAKNSDSDFIGSTDFSITVNANKKKNKVSACIFGINATTYVKIPARKKRCKESFYKR